MFCNQVRLNYSIEEETKLEIILKILVIFWHSPLKLYCGEVKFNCRVLSCLSLEGKEKREDISK